MNQLSIDHEKLADGLERGIGESRTIFAGLPKEDRLRLTACGLVATALYAYAQEMGLPTRLVISQPRLCFDPEMEHVIPLIEKRGEMPLVIDAASSQFLGYAGMTPAYEQQVGTAIFPPEKVVSFPLDDSRTVVDWLVKAVTSFRAQTTSLGTTEILGRSETPLRGASPCELRQTYDQIWNPANLQPWTPPARVYDHGLQLSRYIPEGVIHD